MIGVKNTVFSCFCGLSQIPNFQIISWSPRNTMRLDIPRYKIIYDFNKKSYLRLYILSNKIVCFSSMVFFPALIFICFFSNVLMHTCVHYYWLWKWCIEKDKTPEVIQSENMWCRFCARIDNSQQGSQVILACLLPLLSIICIWNVPFFSALFL